MVGNSICWKHWKVPKTMHDTQKLNSEAEPCDHVNGQRTILH